MIDWPLIGAVRVAVLVALPSITSSSGPGVPGRAGRAVAHRNAAHRHRRGDHVPPEGRADSARPGDGGTRHGEIVVPPRTMCSRCIRRRQPTSPWHGFVSITGATEVPTLTGAFRSAACLTHSSGVTNAAVAFPCGQHGAPPRRDRSGR